MTRRRPTRVEVLQDVLAAEHAVIYGYGVAGAHLTDRARTRAARLHDAHRAARDELVAAIRRLGGEPVAPAPAYALPREVENSRDAVELATLLEERLAAVWADAVQHLRDEMRTRAVDGLREAAVAAAIWRGGSVPFPGLSERAGVRPSPAAS